MKKTSQVGGGAYGTAMLAALKRRLGAAEFAGVADVASAAEVSQELVRQWCDAGYIEAVDVGAHPRRGKGRGRTKAAWRIFVPSVVEFFGKRVGGVQ